MKVPDLRAKLEYLFAGGFNPDVRNQRHLAEYLNISKAAVSNWLCGVGGMADDEVPDKHVRAICDCFGIDVVCFVGRHPPGVFEREVDENIDGWVQLLKCAAIDQNVLRIELEEDISRMGERGIVQLSYFNVTRIPTLPMHRSFRLRLDTSIGIGTEVVMLLRDPVSVSYHDSRDLAGLPLVRQPRSGSIFVPELGQAPFIATETAGKYEWLVVLAADFSKPSILESLRLTCDSVRNDTLKQLAKAIYQHKIARGVESVRVLRYPFLVSS